MVKEHWELQAALVGLVACGAPWSLTMMAYNFAELHFLIASCFRDNVVAAALVACGEAEGAKCALGQHFLELFSRGHGNVVLVVLS